MRGPEEKGLSSLCTLLERTGARTMPSPLSDVIALSSSGGEGGR